MTEDHDNATEAHSNQKSPGTEGKAPGTRMGRRTLVAGMGAGGALLLAGCLDEEGADIDPEPGAEDEPDPDEEGAVPTPTFPEVEDKPDAVYIPTHFEAMRHPPGVETGDYELMPMITYPHRFWNVTGDELEVAAVEDRDDVHLMVTVVDADTGEILPAETGLEMNVGLEGEQKEPYAPWNMLSQEMGFHFGNNIPLDGDGTYEVEVRVGDIPLKKTGDFEGKFETAETGTFTFEYNAEIREEVVNDVMYLDEEEWGRHGALANHMLAMAGMDHDDMDHGDMDHDDMDHDDMGDDHDHDDMNGDMDNGDMNGDMDHDEMDDDMDHDEMDDDMDHGEMDDDMDHNVHVAHDREMWSKGEGHHKYGTYMRGPGEGELPPANDLPGELQGTPMTSDIVLATTIVEGGSRFVEDDEPYLLVSARSPYNRSMLPSMSMEYAITDGDGTVTEGEFEEVLDSEINHHYGVPLDADIEDEQELEITVTTPPQVSRHTGYDTAFMNPEPVSLTITPP